MFVSKLEELDCELELEGELLEDDEGVVLATGEGALELPPPPPQAVRKSTRRKENILINLIEI